MKKGDIKTRVTASGLTRHNTQCNGLVLWNYKKKIYVCPRCNPKQAKQLLTREKNEEKRKKIKVNLTYEKNTGIIRKKQMKHKRTAMLLKMAKGLSMAELKKCHLTFKKN